jgi:hypothetical protein
MTPPTSAAAVSVPAPTVAIAVLTSELPANVERT